MAFGAFSVKCCILISLSVKLDSIYIPDDKMLH